MGGPRAADRGVWAHRARGVAGYAGGAGAGATLAPYTPPPQSANPGRLGGQAAALAQATGTSAAANTQTVLSQLISTVPTALQGLASPSTSAAATSAGGLGILQTLGLASPLSLLTGILQTLGITSPASLLEPTSVGLASSELTTSI